MTVLDVKGIGMKDVGGEVIKFIKTAPAFCGQHYPERGGHVYIVNVPMWFSAGSGSSSRPSSTPRRWRRSTLCAARTRSAPSCLCTSLPQEYGGKSTLALGSAPEENIVKFNAV